jgi:hypothetical protein
VTNLENWAIFEPVTPDRIEVARFDDRDGDLIGALPLHGLHLAGAPGD